MSIPAAIGKHLKKLTKNPFETKNWLQLTVSQRVRLAVRQSVSQSVNPSINQSSNVRLSLTATALAIDMQFMRNVDIHLASAFGLQLVLAKLTNGQGKGGCRMVKVKMQINCMQTFKMGSKDLHICIFINITQVAIVARRD